MNNFNACFFFLDNNQIVDHTEIRDIKILIIIVKSLRKEKNIFFNKENFVKNENILSKIQKKTTKIFKSFAQIV